jgi:hypothetical protein
VKASKDQDVALKATIPASYAEIVIAIRLKTPKNDGLWKDLTPSAPVPGVSSEVKAKVDVLALGAKAGDKLELELKLRARPEAQWEEVPADKSINVAGS